MSNIVIAGAGIGGLSAALALSQAGYQVTLVERAIQLEEAGAGVQLAANATRCLASIGVLERVRAQAVCPRAFRVVDGRRGTAITQAPMGEAAKARFGGEFLVIHRADLQSALLATVQDDPNIELRLGHTVEGFAQSEGGVTLRTAHLEGEALITGDALIGADGLRSTIRQQLHPEAKPVFRHRAAWRATVPAGIVPEHLTDPVTRLWLGPGAHLVTYPVRGGAAVNLVAITPDERAVHGWGLDAAPHDLLRHYRGWSADAMSLLEAPKHWLRWALFDIDPMPLWGEGRVTLLGDAAHAMPPFLAQGAAQAIEDAVVLAQCLKGADDIPAALRRYESLRIPRTAKVQIAARGMDRIYHLKGPARMARDLVMRARAGNAVLERYRWIYGWRA